MPLLPSLRQQQPCNSQRVRAQFSPAAAEAQLRSEKVKIFLQADSIEGDQPIISRDARCAGAGSCLTVRA